MEQNVHTNAWIPKAVVVAFLDVIAMIAVNFTALWMRYDFRFASVPEDYVRHSLHYLPYCIGMTLVVYYIFKLYQMIWRFA
ncbi:MAG: hypothetical protein IJT32_02955, partial [Lachnospiraceae bacterium]|nr:hypothetical protein [Lachnospiraceae bacterium]